MSFIHEIHNQKPVVRYALFGLSLAITFSVIGFFGITALQREVFMTFHTDAKERADFLAQQERRQPKPLAAVTRVARSMTASIGSLLGFNPDAGFDRNEQRADTHDAVYLLPLSR